MLACTFVDGTIFLVWSFGTILVHHDKIQHVHNESVMSDAGYKASHGIQKPTATTVDFRIAAAPDIVEAL